MRLVLAASALTLLACSGVPSAASPSSPRVTVGGCAVFPADNWWHADISALPVDTRSAAWLSHMSTGVDLHPDFGSSFGDGPDYGLPITVVDSSHALRHVRFRYADESDKVGYPLGKDTGIEGGRRSTGDRHAVIVNSTTCRLYETWLTRKRHGHWKAGSGATWDLASNALRPDDWTSADAAGLPILPGLLRWDEVHDGTLDHAIRFTTDVTSNHHLYPARHDAGSTDSWAYPPMGARFRLDPEYATGGYSDDARTIIAAMQTYGLVLADNGSPWYFQGEQNAGWPHDLLDELKSIPADAFVAVDTGSLVP